MTETPAKGGPSRARADARGAGRGPARPAPEGRGGWIRWLRRCVWLLACLLTPAAVWMGVRALERSPLFAVREIWVEGCQRLGPEEVRALLRDVQGASLLTLDGARLARALESRVPVRNASVIKRFPHRLEVRIRERRPAALVNVRDTLCTLDGEGVVLYPVRPGDPLDLPLITGLETRDWVFGRPDRGAMVQGALSLLRVLERSRLPGRLSEIHVDADQGMSFFLEGFPVEVLVGWDGRPSQIEPFRQVLAQLAAEPDGVVRVDLRFRGQVIVHRAETVRKRMSWAGPEAGRGGPGETGAFPGGRFLRG